jgi:hypothetical protein
VRRRFSIGEAIGEPLRLAFKRPLMTMAWGLLSILPGFITFAAMGPLLIELIQNGDLMANGGPAADDFSTFNQFMIFQAWSGLANILGLLAYLLVTTAVIRAVLAGRRRDGAAFVRLSKDEFYVAVIGLAIGVGVTFVVILGGLLVAIFGGIAVGTGEVWSMLAALGLGTALFLAVALIWGRLALIAPVSVMTGELAFAAGWRAGRGQTGRLFLLGLALIGVSILIGIGFLILFVLTAIVFGGGLEAWADEAAVEAWMLAQLENPGLLPGIGAVALIPLSWFQGFSAALWTAPYAVAARGLAPPTAPVGADAPEPTV